MTRPGAVAEWLGRGLQSLVQRFESAPRLFVPLCGRFASQRADSFRGCLLHEGHVGGHI